MEERKTREQNENQDELGTWEGGRGNPKQTADKPIDRDDPGKEAVRETSKRERVVRKEQIPKQENRNRTPTGADMRNVLYHRKKRVSERERESRCRRRQAEAAQEGDT